MALVLAFLLGNVLDLGAAQLRRLYIKQTEALYMATPSPSLIYGSPAEAFMFQIRRKDGILANPGRLGQSVDNKLIATALKKGLRVFVTREDLVRKALEGNPTLRARPAMNGPAHNALWELVSES